MAEIEEATETVVVKFSSELIKTMGEWSRPLQVRIERWGTEWTMAFRIPEFEVAGITYGPVNHFKEPENG